MRAVQPYRLGRLLAVFSVAIALSTCSGPALGHKVLPISNPTTTLPM